MGNKLFSIIFASLFFLAGQVFSEIPNAPSNLHIQYVFSSAINLAWDDNSLNESGFFLERSTDGINYTRIQVLQPNTSSYPDIGLTTTTKYYYRICAFNAAGNSAYSNITSGVPSFMYYCLAGTDTLTALHPFYNTYSDSRTQMLYLKTDFTGPTCSVGYIWTIGFYYKGTSSVQISNITIKLKNTTDSVLTKFIDTGFTTVVNNYTIYMNSNGWNNIGLMQTFIRDVNKNLLVEVCLDRTAPGTVPVPVRSTLAPNKVWHNHKNTGSGCTLDSGYTIPERPNIQFVSIIDGVRKISSNTPDKYTIEQNYPNPFNGETKFRFSIKEPTPVTLSIYDILGRQEVVVFSEPLQPGEYEKTFSINNHPLPSGIYYYCFVANGFVSVKKMVILK